MDKIKKLWWLVFPAGYGITGIIFTVAIFANGGPRPILGGLFWPIRLIKMLLGTVGE